jgi:hypothetical protein
MRQQKPRTQKANEKRKRTKYQQTFIPQTGSIGWHAHKLEDSLDLRIVAYQGAVAHVTDRGYNVPGSYMGW